MGNYQNLGIVEFELANSKAARKYFNLALKFGKTLNDSIHQSRILIDYGKSLYKEERYRESLEKYYRAQDYLNKANRKPIYFRLAGNIGQNLLYLSKLKQAESYLTEARKGLKKTDAKNWLSEVELSLAKLYAKNGNWEKFNHHLDEYKLLRSEILKKEELRSLSEMRTSYETEKKDNRIALQDTKLEHRKNQLLFIGGITFLFVIGVIILWKFNLKIRNKNKELVQKNVELSEKWNRLQNFYLNLSEELNEKNSSGLFARIAKLVHEEKLYTKTNLTVNDLAVKLNTNVKYISTAIKEETEMNFNTFINTHRIEEAKKILLNQKQFPWTLEAIATQCGFNNTTSFYQSFKKITVLTPTTYRKIVA